MHVQVHIESGEKCRRYQEWTILAETLCKMPIAHTDTGLNNVAPIKKTGRFATHVFVSSILGSNQNISHIIE